MITNRRNFLKNSSALAAGLGFSYVISAKIKSAGNGHELANVNIAVIGVGMGCRDLQGALTNNPWVHCLGMCDVNKQRLEEQAARFRKDFPDQTSNLQLYTDFRKLLD